MWPVVRGAIGRYHELVLAGTFLGMAAYEAAEIWMLERPGSSSVPAMLFVHALQVAVILVAAVAIVRAWQRKTTHAEALARLVERTVFAQEQERRRVAYELHDGISPLIVSAKQHADTCRDLWASDPCQAESQLATCVDRLHRAIVETRRILMALRPSAVASGGLGAAIKESLEEAARDAGWTTGFYEDLGDERLPAVVETSAFRIVQETLANAWKHARAAHVDVELRRDGEWLHLDVRDQGVGFASGERVGRRRGLGLLSMQERARLVGGVCTIESAPGRGTRVRARLPLRAGA